MKRSLRVRQKTGRELTTHQQPPRTKMSKAGTAATGFYFVCFPRSIHRHRMEAGKVREKNVCSGNNKNKKKEMDERRAEFASPTRRADLQQMCWHCKYPDTPHVVAYLQCGWRKGDDLAVSAWMGVLIEFKRCRCTFYHHQQLPSTFLTDSFLCLLVVHFSPVLWYTESA